MTVQNRKRVPQLLGPRWQELSLAPEGAPEEASFHASLRNCAESLVEDPEPQVSLSIQPRPAEPQQPRSTLLQRSWSWLHARNASPENKQLQVVEPAALENSWPSYSNSSQPQRPRSGVLAHVWSWLYAKYASPAAKRLRVAEMVPLGEKRFLAVVCVEGREFLIGGGASGVSVVTQLGTSRESSSVPRIEFGFQGKSE
jgi:hypothetical protein